MRYEILGPLRVIDRGHSSFISARKVETVLSALLIQAERVVAFDQLITEIWGNQPPKCATAGLHTYVSQLRKFLSRPERTASPIVTRSRGYVLHIGLDELDVHTFQRQLSLGRQCARQGCHDRAATYFEDALALWRGPLLANVRRGPILDGFESWVTELRLECAELLVESKLALYQHREVVSMLSSLIAEHPFHEVFYCQLMVALYRSRRQADALETYQSARRMLNAHLGLEPCQELRDLQRAVLAADRRLEAAPGQQAHDRPQPALARAGRPRSRLGAHAV